MKYIVTLIAILTLPVYCIAQSALELTKKLFTNGCGGNLSLVDKFSISLRGELSQEDKKTIIADLESDFKTKTSQSYGEALKKYEDEKLKSNLTKMALEANKLKWEAIGDYSGNIIKADPDLESKVILKTISFLGKKSLEYSTDYLKEQADESRRKSLDGLLYNVRKNNSADLARLKSNSAIDERTFIDIMFSSNPTNNQFYEQLESSDKVIFVKQMQDELKDAVKASQIDNLGRDQKLAQAITQNAGTLQKIQKGLERNLIETNRRVTAISEAQKKIQDNLSSLQARTDLNSRDLDFIKDYLYGNMNPADKLRAIDAGFLDNLQESDKAKEREKIELLKAQEEFISNSKAYLNDAQNILNIANNLGINSPLLEKAQEAVSILNTGVAAFGDFSSGNYLGAVASLTGIFGKKSDPVMGKLNEMNKKLDKILQGQQVMMQQLDQIQKGINQLLVGQQLLYDKLIAVSDNIDQKLNIIYDQIKSVHIDVLTNRNRIHDYSSKKQLDVVHSFIIRDGSLLNAAEDIFPNYDEAVNNIIIPNSAQFVNFEFGLYKIFSVNRSQKISNLERYHEIFDIPSDFKMTDFIKDDDPLKDKNVKTILELLRIDTLFRYYLSENKTSKKNDFYLGLLIPFVKCSDLSKKSALTFNDEILKNNDEFNEISNFLNSELNSPFLTETANNFLEPRYVITATDDLINYYYLYSFLDSKLTLISPYDVVKGKAIYPQKIELLKNARFIVDIGIAQQVMLSGDLLIPYIYSKLKNGLVYPAEDIKTDDASIQRLCLRILENNDLVRYNFIKFYISKRFSEFNRNIANYSLGLSLPTTRYMEQSLKVVDNVTWTPNPTSSIQQLKFSLVKNNETGFVQWNYGIPIMGGTKYAYYPLPSSTDKLEIKTLDELKNNKVAYRNALDELLKYRKRLNLMISDIEVSKDLSAGTKEGLNKMIFYSNLITN